MMIPIIPSRREFVNSTEDFISPFTTSTELHDKLNAITTAGVSGSEGNNSTKGIRVNNLHKELTRINLGNIIRLDCTLFHSEKEADRRSLRWDGELLDFIACLKTK